MLHFIYRWKDPRNPDIILCTKYVGMTNNPNARINYHMICDGTNPKKDAWIRGLKSMHIKPLFEIIEVIYEGRSATLKKEQEWIRYYLDHGCDLFNIKVEEAESSHAKAVSKVVKKRRSPNPSQRNVVKPPPTGRPSPLRWG